METERDTPRQRQRQEREKDAHICTSRGTKQSGQKHNLKDILRDGIERDKEIKRAHLTINRAIKREVLKKVLDF